MGQRIFYEDVKKGMEIPSKRIIVDVMSQVKWACVDGNFNPIHYDKEYALSKGLPTYIVHGRYKDVLIAQMLMEWVGDYRALRKLALEHREMDIVGNAITFKGIVKKCIREGHKIECEVWCESPEGKKTVHGVAMLTLLSRRSRQKVNSRLCPKSSARNVK